MGKARDSYCNQFDWLPLTRAVTVSIFKLIFQLDIILWTHTEKVEHASVCLQLHFLFHIVENETKSLRRSFISVALGELSQILCFESASQHNK